ncbi:MAG: signal recognition particle receptor subunit alpha, partial [Clostridia bacterium]|nr:signal recognition particle receptor subunit alpha [Clostridia bacterium]
MGFFDKLKAGLEKTRNQISERTMDVISIFKKVDEALFEELEEVLIMSDVGFETSSEIIERLRQKAREEKITEAEGIQAALQEIIGDILSEGTDDFEIKTSPAVI